MKRKLIITVSFLSFFLSSCLKGDDRLGFINDKGSIVSEIYDVNPYGAVKFIPLNALPTNENVVLITLKVYSPGASKPQSDITLTLVRNDALVTAQGLTVLPPAAFTLPSLSVVVPKATGVAELSIPLNKAVLNLSLQYGLAFDLTTASEGVVSSLAKRIVVAIVIKNAYDADYTQTGFFFHPSAPRAMAGTKHLSTLGAITCGNFVGDLASFTYKFDISGSTLNNWVGIGAPNPASVSGASGFMTLDNPGGIDYSSSAPDATGAGEWTLSKYNNTYDAATKTLWAHYGYLAGAANVGATQAGYTRQVYEKLVRK